jgi:DNA-binding SARP family transcriptional activator
MDFRLLGPLEVAEHDRSVVLGGVKQRALLAVLLLHANDVVSTEQLVDEVWGESPPATVAKSIQVYVSRLRKQFHGRFRRRRAADGDPRTRQRREHLPDVRVSSDRFRSGAPSRVGPRHL